MTFEELLTQVIAVLQREGRISYRALQRRFDLDDAYLDDVKVELIEAKQLARDENGRILVWAEQAATTTPPPTAQEGPPGSLPVVQTPQEVSAPVAPSAPEAERRQLTVLFCDLADSTHLARQLDPEDLREVIRAYQATCVAVTQRFAGHVAQYLGDGLLVYFGYPQAHEDDAQRAVRTGLGILEAMATLPLRLLRDTSVRLAVRIGIHTGLVVVGEMGSGGRHEHLALGDTPNLAARLQGLAAPNTVVISAATARLVHGYFTCHDLGTHALKGLETPVLMHQVLGESAAQSRLDVAGPTGLTPLVGRETEVALLRERWAQSTNGLGQVVLLSGEAGIGKSRLVEVLREQVGQEGCPRIVYRCSSYYQQSALYPVIEHLHRLLQWSRDETAAMKLAKLEQTLQGYRLALDEAVPLLAALLSLPLPEARYAPLLLSPQRQRQKTLEVLLAWLRMEAERQPLLVVWEDLHWADPSTLEFLNLLIDQTPTAHMLMLCTCRPEFRPPWPPRSYLTQDMLGRLGGAQVEAMITRITGGKALPAAVVQQIVAKTDGVPLFVEELTKAILESDLVREEEDHYELRGPLPPLAIPATLHDSLMARLDRLATVKEVAQLAATLGRTFPYDLLQAVTPLDEVTLQHALARLVEVELLYQRGMPPQATYIFKHALIQETAYQALLKSTRQQYHQRIAQVLTAHFSDIAETQPELLAHHYTEAGLSAQAVGYWQQAGQRTIERSAYVEAMSHVTKGIEVLHTLPGTPERAQHELTLQLLLLVPVRALKGLAAPDVEPIYTRLGELCQQRGESLTESFPIVIELWGFYANRGELRRACTYAEQCLALAQRADASPSALPKAHWALGVTLVWCGEMSAAHTHLAQALSYSPERYEEASFPSSPSDPTVACLTHAALALWWSGHIDQALERMHQARTRAQELSIPFSLAFAYFGSALLHLFRREMPAVHEHTECLMALTTEHGFVHWGTLGMFLQGWVLVAQGQQEAGLTQMRQGIAANHATGQELVWPYFLALLAEAETKAGQRESGLLVLTDALALMDRHAERFWEAELHRLQGTLLQQAIRGMGNAVVTPEECFGQALAIAGRQQAKSWELRAATSLARLWQRQGKRNAAHELLAPIYDWFTEGFDTADLQEAKALLEELG